MNRRNLLKTAIGALVAACCGLKSAKRDVPRLIGIVADEHYKYDPNCYEMLVSTPTPVDAQEVRDLAFIPRFGSENKEGNFLRRVELSRKEDSELLWSVVVEYGAI